MNAAAELAAALGGAVREGAGWRARCPAHDDHDPSLGITEKAGKTLFRCYAGCEQSDVLAALRLRHLWPGPTDDRPRIPVHYNYRDHNGTLKYQVVRQYPKKFFQRRPNGSPDKFISNMDGIVPLPYRLPELLGDPDAVVYITEGEKDADNLAEIGIVATCNHGGAGKWRSEISQWLKNRHVVILPDNDNAGRAHAADVAKKLTGIAASIRILELPALPPKGDASDWLSAGGTADELERLAAATAPIDIDRMADATAAKKPQGDLASEDALALKFSEKHAETLRYVNLWGKWLQWDGARWKFEDTLFVFDLARNLLREIDETLAEADILNARTVAAVERLAKADRRHARTHDIWDLNDFLLNTPGGVVNLSDGAIGPHDPNLHCTKITAVSPGGDCPLWRQFLSQITAGNDGLPEFLQRVAGYCLTGETSEHAMFFGYGTGGNGKGVFLNTLTAVLGDYAAVAPTETFMVSRNERHPTDLAGLRGARFVTAQEVEDGQRWAESKIKSLTGGDPISARFMRQDYFTYLPKFKLFIAGNHRPALRSVDEAIRRRFFLVPFVVRIPAEKRDKNLAVRLKAEWPGILQWAIDGCLEWQRIGLAPPPCVSDATAAYLEAEDSVTQWLADCCAVGANLKAENNELFSSFSRWSERSGEIAGHRKALFAKLDSRDFSRWAAHGKRGYFGFAIRQEDTSDDYWNR